MALRANLTLNTYGGLALPAAYVRVTSARAFKAPTGTAETPGPEAFFVEARYEVFMDEAARLARKNPLDAGNLHFQWDTLAQPDIMAACYASLKALEAFVGAEDC